MILTTEKTLQASLQGMVSRGVRSAHIDGNGDLIFCMTDGALLNLGKVSEGGGLYLVTVTGSDADGYTADRGYEELRDAIRAGRTVLAELQTGARGSFYGQLTACSDTVLTFGGWQRKGTLDLSFVITMTPDGGVIVGYPTYAQEPPTTVTTVKDGSTVTVTAEYGSGSTVSVVTLDEDGDPVSVTTDGVTTALSWEGFDE